MARLSEISIEDVARACDYIQNLDQRPTVDRVRAILKKGSKTTINRLLREHLKQQEKIKPPSPTTYPSAALVKIQEAFQVVGQDLEETISQLRRLVEERDQHIQEILTEGEERELDLERTASALEDGAKHLKELETQNKELKKIVEDKNKKLEGETEMREQYIALKARNETILEQMEEYRTKIRELESENKKFLIQSLKKE